MQPVIIEQRDGVIFETPHKGPAITRFLSKTEDHHAVMTTVVNYCDTICLSIGCFDFRVRFNIASCPDDMIHGEIEWIGF